MLLCKMPGWDIICCPNVRRFFLIHNIHPITAIFPHSLNRTTILIWMVSTTHLRNPNHLNPSLGKP